MQLDLTPDQKTFQATARKALEKEVPLTRIREMVEAGEPFDRDWWAAGAELGWTAMLVPEELGGGTVSGEGLRDLAIIAEEFGRGVVPGPLIPVNVVLAGLVEVVPDQPHHAETVEALLAGEAVATWAAYEPGEEWAPLAPRTVAKPSAEGFLIDGTKDRVEVARSADLLLVLASAPEGTSQFLVPASAPGVTITPTPGIDLTRDLAEVRFDRVEVPASAMVGPAGDVAALVERQLQVALALQLADTCGALGSAFDLSVQWAFDRYSFGRPLASYQALKHRWADQKTWLEASLATTEAAVRAVGARTDDAAELVSVAKSYVGDRAVEVIQDTVQLFGGIGVTYEHDAHFYLRRATANRYLYGTPTEHRQRLARQLAG
ncbi:acyl-CoA dehydrogenase family protein [Nocardioides sp. YIM 152588]|uniref:acyl-CoA dehydrogenase family protein n=1 Tax=Nocardioides sp. YIM 152588 TaxID=3158259 RepID=UPI0032E368FC